MNRSSRRLMGHVLALILLPLSLATLADTDINETRAVNSDATVSISNVEGSIEVTGWNQNEVRITGTLGKGVEGLEISGDESRLEIEVQYPRSGWTRHKTTPSELIVQVPAGAQLIASGVSADITVEGINGRVRAESVSGEIEVMGSPAELKVNSVSGDVTLDVGTESIHYSSVSGDLDLSGLAGEFSGNAVSGSINVVADIVTSFDAETVSGDIDLRGPLAEKAELEMNTLSGDILLALSKDLSAKITFDTFSGDIYGDFDIPDLENEKSLRFTVGNGDVDINVHTFSGSVELKRSN